MGHHKVIALAVSLSLALGCASTRWAVQKSLRQPGESLEDFPEAVWEEYDCASQRRPFFVIEKNELLPPRLDAGGEFNHRFVYAMCPVGPTEVVSGLLSTRIRFRGNPIVVDTANGYEIKPGRWVVDAMIKLPEDAEPGVYAHELVFASPELEFEKRLTFVVHEP